jgi:hypothetical protein
MLSLPNLVVIRRIVVALVLSALATVLMTVGVPVNAQASSSASTISTSEYPIGMDFDSSGNLFIASQKNDVSGNLGLVVIPEDSGTLFGQAVVAGQENLLVSTSAIRGVAVDSNDDVFYSLSDGGIYALTSSTRTVFGVSVSANSPTQIATASSLRGPLEFDADGNLWGVYPSSSSVGVLPVSTTTLFNQSVTANTEATYTMASGSWVWDIAFDGSGNLLYSDGWGNQGVWIYSKSSGTFFGQSITAFTATELTGFSGVFGRAAGIDTDSAGNVFAVLYGSAIYVFSPSGGDFIGQSVSASSLTQLTDTSGKTQQGVAVSSDGKIASGAFSATFLFAGEASESSGSAGSSSANPDAGVPGIFLTVAGPVGRSAAESPVYYGADRVAVTSTYLLTVTRVSNVTPTITTLAEGTIDADGSFSSMTRLPALAPGTYNVQMVGTHVNGSTLQLTSQVTIGGVGQFTSIGANIPVIK